MLTRQCAIVIAGLVMSLIATTAHADALVTGTTYKFADGLNYHVCCEPGGSPVLTTEAARAITFGSGILNNGKIGIQSYLDTPGNPRPDGVAVTPFPAYQVEGPAGDINGGLNVLGGNLDVTFDLGGSYDLTKVRIDFNQAPNNDQGVPSSVTISDGVNPNVVFNTFPAADGGATGFGKYHFVEVDISSLSGSTIQLVFTGTDAWGGYNEISFYAVPEPASLALMGLGGVLVLRRRR